MCGISGFISTKHNLETKINNTLRLMSSRGPDHQNHVKFKVKKNTQIKKFHIN